MSRTRTSHLALLAILLASPFLCSMSIVLARHDLQSLTAADTAKDLYLLALRDVPTSASCRDSDVFQPSPEFSAKPLDRTDSCRFVTGGYRNFYDRGWHLTRLEGDELRIVHAPTGYTESIRKAGIEYIEFHPTPEQLRSQTLLFLAPFALTALIIGGITAATW